MEMHTLIKTAVVIATTSVFPVLAARAATEQTVYDPSPADPRIVGALESERRMERAGASSDFDAMGSVRARLGG